MNDFAELDALLAESTALATQRQQLATLRDPRKAAGQPNNGTPRRSVGPSALPAHRQEVLALESVLEWRTTGGVVFFHRFRCHCGAEHVVFSHYSLRQESLLVSNSRRWVKATSTQWRDAKPGFKVIPVAYHNSETPMCGACAPTEHGIDMGVVQFEAAEVGR